MRKSYPNISFTPIAGAIEGKLIFSHYRSAEKYLLKFLDHVQDIVIISEQPLSCKIWIYDYLVTNEERKIGYLGNFAILSILKQEGGDFKICIEKELAGIEDHPKKKDALSKMTRLNYINWNDFEKVMNDADGNLTYDKANEFLAYLEKNYVVNRKDPSLTVDSIMIWVRDFDVTELEHKSGCLGNYAKVSISHVEGRTYQVSYEKVVKSAGTHPIRREVTRRLPNMGSPIIRKIYSNSRYATYIEANEILNQLKSGFPDACIQRNFGVLVHIYRRDENRKVYQMKVTLSIEQDNEGYYFLIEDQRTSKHRSVVNKFEDEYYSTFYIDFLGTLKNSQ